MMAMFQVQSFIFRACHVVDHGHLHMHHSVGLFTMAVMWVHRSCLARMHIVTRQLHAFQEIHQNVEIMYNHVVRCEGLKFGQMNSCSVEMFLCSKTFYAEQGTQQAAFISPEDVCVAWSPIAGERLNSWSQCAMQCAGPGHHEISSEATNSYH